MGHHANRNPRYFAENLPTNQHWRLYGDFQDSCAFIDIETTGLSHFDEITTIVLYDGRRVRSYVNGNLIESGLYRSHRTGSRQRPMIMKGSSASTAFEVVASIPQAWNSSLAFA